VGFSSARDVLFSVFFIILGGSMANWQDLERKFQDKLPMSRRPVAVAFLGAVPSGVPAFDGTMPSGCSFWRLAAEGGAFYTVPADHFNCAVGSYTHNIPLSPEREKETEQTLGLMFQIGYIKPEEVPGIPRLKKTPAAIVYSPLGAAPVDLKSTPSAVLFACKPSAAMLLNEAAIRAGAGGATPALGRPTCMGLPLALERGTQMSLGCIGNRTYTGLGEDELYIIVAGKDLERVAASLEEIVGANNALQQYAEGRRAQLATS
jgi:uncharacterized protein (DUF169 family)